MVIIMKTFYKKLLSIGIAIGVFCSLFVFTAGQRQWSAMKLRDKILDSNIYKIVESSSDYVYFMGLDEARQIISLLPEDCLTDLQAPSHTTAISYDNEPIGGKVIGTEFNYNQLLGMETLEGRFLSEEDVREYRKVCVVNSSFYDLIRTRNADHVDINGEAYEIIGVVSESSSGLPMDGDIIVPVTTLYKYIEKTDVKSGLIYQIIFDKGTYTKAELLDIIKAGADLIDADTRDLKLMPMQYDEFSNNNDFIKIFSAILLISLLVLTIAAFNIIHIATASIMDREREIGLKTALGATTRHIIAQITGEILLCSLRGGLAGVALASIVNTIMNLRSSQLTLSFNIVTIITGILLATIAGLITSLIPARNAAKLDPSAALREE